MIEKAKAIINDLDEQMLKNLDEIHELEERLEDENSEYWLDEDYDGAEVHVSYLKKLNRDITTTVLTLLEMYDLYRWYCETFAETRL